MDASMDASLKSLRPGDPRLIDSIVSHLKCEGIFDEFRKSCLADVDTKPAYQNLRIRVESFADDYLKVTSWRSDLNKNHLRDGLRRRIHESGLLTTGVDRIIDQIVNPKIIPFFFPKIVEIVNRLLGIKNLEISQSMGLSLADKDELSTKSLVAVAQSLLQSKDELFAVPTTTVTNEEVTNAQKKVETKNPKDASKMKPNETKSKTTSVSILKTPTVSKHLKSNEGIKPIFKKEAGTSKTKHPESPKKDDESGKKSDTKFCGSVFTDVKKMKHDKQKPIEKSKSENKDEIKNKVSDKIKSSDKGLDNKSKSIEKQKSVEEKNKSRDKSGSNIIIKKSDKNPEKHFSSEIEASVYSQSNRTPKDDKYIGKKQNPKHKSSKILESKSGDYKLSEKKSAAEAKAQTSKEKFRSQFSSRDLQKRKLEGEGSPESKKFKRDSSSKETSPNKLDLDDGELSDVTVSSVHTSDLSDFDDNISLSDIEDEDSGSPNQKTSKNTKAEKRPEESNVETAEEKKACLQISEDALMSSDELRTSTGARAGKNAMNTNEPKRELRRHRKLNSKYTSDDFSTIFARNYDKHSQYKNHYEKEHKDIASDSKVSQHISAGFTNLNEKCNLLGSPISDTPSEPEVSKCGITDNFHSPILSSDDGLDSNGSSSRNASKCSPKPQFERKTLKKQSNRRGSSPENYSSQQSSSLSHVRYEPAPTFSKKSISKSDSRQRYASSDLYKPRPVIVNSRRRGSSSASIEKRALLDTEYVSSGEEGISPKSGSNDTGSPNLLKKSPKYHSEAHLPFNKRRRLLQN